MKKYFYFALVLFLAACSSKVIAPSQANLESYQASNPDVSLADLKAGKEIFKEQCNLCHGYYAPNAFSADDWKKIMPGMVANVNKKTGSMMINPEMEKQLLDYVLAVR